MDNTVRGEAMLILGEAVTSLLRHSVPLSPERAGSVLGPGADDQPHGVGRPIAHLASAGRLTGVDCRLPTTGGARVRAVGTVAHRAAITGGRVVQAFAMVRLARDRSGSRRRWPHYLARPGTLDLLSGADEDDLAGGFLAAPGSGRSLDLGAVAARTLAAVQGGAGLDGCPPFPAAPTSLRWAVAGPEPDARSGPAAIFQTHGVHRTLRLTCPEEWAVAAVGVCEDVALHDWLLTMVLVFIERSGLDSAPGRRALERLRPVISELFHLWMPAARIDGPARALWDDLERRYGLGRQWRASVDRIRDQIGLAAAGPAGPPAGSGVVE